MSDTYLAAPGPLIRLYCHCEKKAGALQKGALLCCLAVAGGPAAPPRVLYTVHYTVHCILYNVQCTLCRAFRSTTCVEGPQKGDLRLGEESSKIITATPQETTDNIMHFGITQPTRTVSNQRKTQPSGAPTIWVLMTFL